MSAIYLQIYQSPYGPMILGSFDNQLCLCDWQYRKARRSIDYRLQQGLKAKPIQLGPEHKIAVLERTQQQLGEYFFGTRNEFTLPILTVGTPFQESVWQSLQQIRYGETSTYSRLAASIDKRAAVRAVANANAANALSIIIPCHRIIGSDGNLTGYAGGIVVKEKLITLEKQLFNAHVSNG